MRYTAAMPSPRNRSVVLGAEDRERLAPRILEASVLPDALTEGGALPTDRVIHGDCLQAMRLLPRGSVDLLVADPPYNLDLVFGTERGRRMSDADYEAFTDSWLDAALPLLKAGASVYVFGDWRGSSALYRSLSGRLAMRNRIVWEREKGRAASRNWKSAHEEIWFATAGEDYYFDDGAVRQRRKVIAPYRDSGGKPRDWFEDNEAREGKARWRDTAASNIWTDLSVPFWSMPENTVHPTQKPEKLLAKIILASCPEGGLVLDPFLGSGTSAVTAKKLGRRFLGIELDAEYCLLAQKRLELAGSDRRIQGFEDGVFWERNSAPQRPKARG